MCLINGTTPIKCGSSVMLPACQHFALASVRRRRQSAGTQLDTAWCERDKAVISLSSSLLCLREASVSMVGVLVTQFSLILCGFFLLCITQKTIVSLRLPSIKLSLHPVLKAESLIFFRMSMSIRNWPFSWNCWHFFTEVIIYLELSASTLFSHKS